jgi:S1-C subfamily serine protease
MTGNRCLAALLGAALLCAPPAPADAETLNQVYRRVSTSVVVIRARGDEVTQQGRIAFREVGSGVLISADGKIATAAHVVHSLTDITVEFIGEEPVPARVIASEPQADISLIQVSVVPRDATVSKLADSDQVLVGDPVIIIGVPYGLSYSLSQGIISARWAADTVTKDFPLAEFLQTDAVINTGNSGGPMFTRAGHLIGIVSHNISKSGGSEGLGFVVTTNTFKSLLVDRRRGYFGIDVVLVTGEAAETLKVPQEGGLLVKHVVKDSLGAKIGLKGGDRMGLLEGKEVVVGGDVLLAVQGMPLRSREEVAAVTKALEAIKPGDDLRVRILRNEKTMDLSMKFTGF